MCRPPRAAHVLAGVLGTLVAIVPARSEQIAIEIDATELPRKLLSATLEIPVPSSARDAAGRVALWYPKWVPGVHAAGGPVQNVGGLVFRDASDAGGAPLSWHRAPGEPYLLFVDAKGAGTLRVEIRYIANQPTANSMGIDTFGSELIGFVSPNTVLLVPDGASIRATTIAASIVLPDTWRHASALRQADEDDRTGRGVIFGEVTLETFVDSPILVGAFARSYDLVEPEHADATPPHTLHVFSESKTVLDIDETALARFRRMVSEATLLFDSHPFPSFDVLLAATDVMSRNGLEHLASSFNVIKQRSLESDESLTGWQRMLIPHEYVHAWCGKYRRPEGMVTTDFHTPKDTRLLWVYEGLTQYLGKALEVRSGLMSHDAFVWYVRQQLRSAMHRQGRAWRPLDDTAAASGSLRSGSMSWGQLRRGQDYYHEGALIWLEADARIRNLTDGKKSLDDFCRVFFAHAPGDPVPNGYTRGDVIATLEGVVSDDWDTFVRARIEEPADRFRLDLLDEIGYEVQYSNEAPEPPKSERSSGPEPIVMAESIGAALSSKGLVMDVLLGSPADEAGLGPGMKVIGVDGFVFTKGRMEDAITESAKNGTIELLLESGERHVTKTIDYDGGPRHLVLVRDDDEPDRLSEITKPLDDRPLP